MSGRILASRVNDTAHLHRSLLAIRGGDYRPHRRGYLPIGIGIEDRDGFLSGPSPARYRTSFTSTSISLEFMSTMVAIPVRVKPPPADIGETISPTWASLDTMMPSNGARDDAVIDGLLCFADARHRETPPGLLASAILALRLLALHGARVVERFLASARRQLAANHDRSEAPLGVLQLHFKVGDRRLRCIAVRFGRVKRPPGRRSRPAWPVLVLRETCTPSSKKTRLPGR